MAIRHVQRQRLSGAVFAAIILTCLALLGGGLLPGLETAVRVALLAAAALMLLVTIEFERLTLVVTDSELLVGFRVFRSRTPIAKITAAREVQVRLWTHGIGVHFTLKGALAITARTGRGVEILRAGKPPLVVSCDDPGALLDAIGHGAGRTRAPR